MWFLLALLSSVFAAATSILAKVGIDGVNSTLATAIRTAVVLVMSWGMVFLTGAQADIGGISRPGIAKIGLHLHWLNTILMIPSGRAFPRWRAPRKNKQRGCSK